MVSSGGTSAQFLSSVSGFLPAALLASCQSVPAAPKPAKPIHAPVYLVEAIRHLAPSGTFGCHFAGGPLHVGGVAAGGDQGPGWLFPDPVNFPP